MHYVLASFYSDKDVVTGGSYSSLLDTFPPSPTRFPSIHHFRKDWAPYLYTRDLRDLLNSVLPIYLSGVKGQIKCSDSVLASRLLNLYVRICE